MVSVSREDAFVVPEVMMREMVAEADVKRFLASTRNWNVPA